MTTIEPSISRSGLNDGPQIDLGSRLTEEPKTSRELIRHEWEIVLLPAKDLEIAECNFWVINQKSGIIRPFELLCVPETCELLQRAVTEGTTEAGPFMLADASRLPARFIYLNPIHENAFREQAVWVSNILSTIRAWNPNTIGFYLQHDHIHVQTVEDILRQVLSGLSEDKPTSRRFLLHVAGEELNSLLNLALNLKADLDLNKAQLTVLH